MVIFTIPHELTKLQSFEWSNCVSTQVASSMQMNINNMLIVDYM